MKNTYKETSEIAQGKINQIIFDHYLKEVDIANALGVTPQNLSYQLHQSQNFDREIERGIYIYLRSKGIVEYQKGHCEIVTDNFLEFTSIIHHQISILANTIRRATANEDISKQEQDRLLNLIDTLLNNSVKQLDDLRISIMGVNK